MNGKLMLAACTSLLWGGSALASHLPTTEDLLKELDVEGALMPAESCESFAGEWLATCSAAGGHDTETQQLTITQKGCEFLNAHGIPVGIGGGLTLTSLSTAKALHVDATVDWKDGGKKLLIQEKVGGRAYGADVFLDGGSEASLSRDGDKLLMTESYDIKVHKKGVVAKTYAGKVDCVLEKTEGGNSGR